MNQFSTQNLINNYLPLKTDEVEKKNIEVHFLSHYLKWHPQANYYYAVKHGNFITSPERMPGTYTKFASIDDKMEDFNYYTLGVKYGIGWTSYVASWEIRDGDLTREEGIALAKKYDLEFPSRFSKDLYDYISLPSNEYPKASKNFEIKLDKSTYGIRAQLFNNNTLSFVNDFIYESINDNIHIVNAVSPAFTSSFSLAELILNNIEF